MANMLRDKKANLGSSQTKRLRKLRQKWHEPAEENREHAEFMFSELGIISPDPVLRQRKMLEKELAELKRIDEFHKLRLEWNSMSDEEREEFHLFYAWQERKLKWHNILMPIREMTQDELCILSWQQLKRLELDDIMLLQERWKKIFQKKRKVDREIASGDAPPTLVVERVVTWASSLWSPSVWEPGMVIPSNKQEEIEASVKFTKSRIALSRSELPDEDCPICCSSFLGKISDGDCISLPCGNNNHCFHRNCIRRWFEAGHFTCPVCRSTNRG